MDLAETMEAERQRLNKVLEEIQQKRIDLDQQERSAHIELAGIKAYLDAKMGKVLVPSKVRAVRATSGTRAPRKTGIRQQVLDLITTEGISKQDLLTALGVGDDKASQQAISNSLVALKKDGKIISGERGTYKLPAPTTATSPTDTTLRRVKKEVEKAAAPTA